MLRVHGSEQLSVVVTRSLSRASPLLTSASHGKAAAAYANAARGEVVLSQPAAAVRCGVRGTRLRGVFDEIGDLRRRRRRLLDEGSPRRCAAPQPPREALPIRIQLVGG